jgi:hypothetical protein
MGIESKRGSTDRIGDRMIKEMEWIATQWVIMQPASSSDEGVMAWGLKIFDQFWAVFIAVIGGNSSSSTPLNSVMNSVIR